MFLYFFLFLLFTLVQAVVQVFVLRILSLITTNQEDLIKKYHFFFFPGIFIHELSHFLMASVLGVRTGKFMLFPQVWSPKKKQSGIALGSVETEMTDPIRGTLIGGAPLLSGVALLITFANYYQINDLWLNLKTGSWGDLGANLSFLGQQPSLFLTIPLLFIITHTMMPSAADQREWFPFLILSGLFVLAYFLTDNLQNLSFVFDYALQGLQYLAATMVISVLINLIMLPLIIFLYRRVQR